MMFGKSKEIERFIIEKVLRDGEMSMTVFLHRNNVFYEVNEVCWCIGKHSF